MNIDGPPMNEISRELLRLVALNHQEQWVPTDVAIQQLEYYGDRLIPGLVLALDDANEEVRLLAMNLLDEAGSRSTPALPIIIRMLRDEDRTMRLSTGECLQKFGLLAIEAVPLLWPWLFDDHEYVRLLAAITITCINPKMRDEMSPVIRTATGSANPMVRFLAEEFMTNH